MRRRTLLGLTGAIGASLAGCFSESGTPGTDRATTTASDDDTDTPTTDVPPTTPETDVNVTVDALQPGVVTRNTPDSIAVTHDEGQYLLLSVGVESGTPPARDEFLFDFAGGSFPPFEPDPPLWVERQDGESGYDAETGSGRLVFELPETGDAGDAALTWPGGEWRPDDALRDRLAAPLPDLTVDVAAPDAIRVGDQPTITLTIANEGDRPGRFVAGLNRVGPLIAYAPVHRFSEPAPAGETITVEHTGSIPWRHYERREDGEDVTVTYHVAGVGFRRSRDIRVTSSTA